MAKTETTPNVIAIFGPPGSGKSAVAGLLVQEYGLERFHFGAIIRELAKKNNPKAIFEYQNSIIPDEVHLAADQEMIKFMKNFPPEKIGIVDAWLAGEFGNDLDNVLTLMITSSWWEAMRRISKREKSNIFQTMIRTTKRELSNESRYKRLYNITRRDYFNPRNADIVINNTRLTLNATRDEAVRSMEEMGIKLGR